MGTATPFSGAERGSTPRVFVDKIKSALRIVATDRAALELGLQPGLTLADARARLPGLDAVDMDPAADLAFLVQLADFCDRYTPLVGLDGCREAPPDGLLLDITGCAHLFGGEAAMRAEIVERFLAGGIETHGAIAGTPDTARALARFSTVTAVPPGGEAEAVRALPVAALDLDAQTVLGLSRAGLKTVGDLAVRPRPPLAARFGADLVDRLARLSGERDIRFTPRRALPVCTAERRFAEAIALQDDVLATLASLASQIAPLLERRGEGGRRFEASLFRVDGAVARLAIETGRPRRDPEMLTQLFRHRMEALAVPLDAGFGFDLIRLTVTATDTLEPAAIDLDSHVVEDEAVAALVDRLATRFGTQAVRRFVAVDTHLPERAAHAVPAMDQGPAGRIADWSLPGPDAMARPIHLFDPPQPIEALAEVPDGPPLKFRWRRILHTVARAEGPERIAAEWWRHDGLTRDYYRIEDDAGRRYWVFREGLYGTQTLNPRWFLHGIFP